MKAVKMGITLCLNGPRLKARQAFIYAALSQGHVVEFKQIKEA